MFPEENSIVNIEAKYKQVQCHKVLLQTPSTGNTYILYCPCYLRVKIKNFLAINQNELNASLNGKVLFDVNLTRIPPLLKGHIMDNMVIRFHRDSVLQLSK